MAKEEKSVVGKVVDGVAKGLKKASDSVEEFASKTGRAGEAMGTYTGTIERAAQSTVELLTSPWQKMAQLIGTNTDAFEKLNQSGMSFGNSMNNIRMAAGEMRMGLEEFTEFMGKNQISFASLGGSVTKSAENFAKLGKEMQQSDLAEKMTQMGLGYQELNEILAIQIGASKSKMGEDEASRRKTIESAMALAEEMDGLAKLTGMSRKEQEDSRKALQRDMALEAGLRLQTRNMSKEDAEKYRENMMNIIETTKAERGEAASNAAKELITSGTLKTTESMASASMDSEGFQAMQRQIAAGKKGDTEGMNRAREEARVASMKMQDNEAYLTVASQVGGTAGNVSRSQMGSMQTQYEGVKAVADDPKNKNLDITRDLNVLMSQQKDIIKKEQEARDGLTAGMIAARNGLADANAAAIRRTGELMGKGTDLEKSAGKLADDRAGGGKQAEYQSMIAKNTPVGDVGQLGSDLGAKAIDALRDVAGQLKEVVKGINESYAKKKDEVQSKQEGKKENKVPTRDGGTLEKTGSPIEPMDALVKIHKGETVLSPEATKDLSKDLSDSTKGDSAEAVSSAMTQLSQSMPKSATGSAPGIDLNKILADIKTTVSKVEISNWPKELTENIKAAQAETRPTPPSEPVQKTEKLPESKQPEIKVPDVKVPEVKVPEIKQGDVKVPEIKVPEVKVPNINVPEVKVPKQPEVKAADAKSTSVPKAVEVINWPKDITNKESTAEVKQAPKAIDVKPAEVIKKSVTDGQDLKAKLASETKNMNKQEAADHTQKRMDQIAKEKAPSEKTAEVKTPKSESYKINGKEVDKKQFDEHMKANPELAKLMDGIKPKAGGDAAPSSSGGKDPAADAMERMKAIQAQVSKVNEETAQKDLANKQTNLEKTQGFAEQQLKIHGKAEEQKAAATQSITLNTLGLNQRQKEMHGELAKLTLDESKAKLDANKQQQQATLAEMRALDAKANAIEETARKEGRALTESEQAQVDAIDKENEEKLKANGKANATMADENKVLEKLIKQKTFAEKEGLEVYIRKDGERVKLVEQNSSKVAKDIADALPVKEISEKKTEFSGQLAEAGKNLDEHGKTTLKYAMTYSSESNAAYKASAEQSIVNTKNQIEEKNKLVAELEEKGKTQELSTREKKRLEITKSEIQELEEKKKFREQEVEAYTIAEKQKKGIIDKSAAEIADAIKESLPVKDIEKGKDLLAERIELQNKAEEDAMLAEEAEIARIETEAQAKFAAAEEEAIAREEVAALLPRSIDLEKQRIELQNKAEEDAMLAEEEEIARIDAAAQAKFAAAEEEAIAREEVEALLPRTIDLEKQRIELQNKAEEDAIAADEEEIARADAAALTAKDALYGIMENVGDNFNDVMSNNMDEFGSNFDEVIGGQLLENMNFKPAEISENISLPSMQADSDYLKTSKPIKGDKESLKTVTEKDTPKTNKIDKEALKASMPKYSDISLDANGMPVVKSKAKELTKKEEPKKEDTSVEDAETAKFKRQGEAAKKAEEEKKKAEGGKQQTANLDDVVKKLDLLNSTMNSLIRKTDEVSANQIKATKSMSGNLFDR